jgi:hypothetical protein
MDSVAGKVIYNEHCFIRKLTPGEVRFMPEFILPGSCNAERRFTQLRQHFHFENAVKSPDTGTGLLNYFKLVAKAYLILLAKA